MPRGRMRAASYQGTGKDALFQALIDGLSEKRTTKFWLGESESLNGLLCIYPNVREAGQIGKTSLATYYEQLVSDNASLIETFRNAGYETLWLPHRGLRATNLEVWPLSQAKKKIVALVVSQCDLRDYSLESIETIYGIKATSHFQLIKQFTDYVFSTFKSRYASLVERLEQDGFTVAARNSPEDTRIVVY